MGDVDWLYCAPDDGCCAWAFVWVCPSCGQPITSQVADLEPYDGYCGACGFSTQKISPPVAEVSRG